MVHICRALRVVASKGSGGAEGDGCWSAVESRLALDGVERDWGTARRTFTHIHVKFYVYLELLIHTQNGFIFIFTCSRV